MNFLFISKLIPLLFYPLGMASILLLTALWLWWKHSRWVPIPVAATLLILFLAGNTWFSNWFVQSLEWQNLPPQELPNADAIVLLGGSLRAQAPPRQTVEITEQGDRVLYAAKLYLDGKAPLIVASGGRIQWMGGGRPESTDMSQLMKMMGVPAWAIIEESDSLNTYENAINVLPILQSKGIKKVLLVTSAMHMPRSLLIFQKQGINVIAAPTDFLVSERELEDTSSTTEAILINLFPDADSLERTTKAIKEYIGIVIYRLRGWL